MAVELRSVGVSPGADSTTCVINKPEGLAVGDLMIAHVAAKATGTAITAPSGWTQVRQDNYTDKVRSGLFRKIADADDVAAASFTFTVGDDANLGAITAWTGYDAASPIGASSSQNNSYYNIPTAPSITPPSENSMILLLFSMRTIATMSDYAIATDNPASWAEAYDRSTTAGSDCAMAMGYAARPETSPTGVGTVSRSAQIYTIGQMVSITPASGGTTEKTSAETGSGADDSSIAAATDSAEAGGGMDARQSFLAVMVKSDSGAGADAFQLFSAGLASAEVGAGADGMASLLAALVKDEVGSGAEQSLLSSLILLLSSDSAVGLDSIVSRLAALVKNDAVIGSEIVSGRGVSRSETGSGADARSALLAAMAGVETGAGLDSSLLTSFIAKLAAETGLGSDAAGLIAALAVFENGLGADSGWLVGLKIIFAGDVGAGLETLRALIESSRAATYMKLPGKAGQVTIPSKEASLWT